MEQAQPDTSEADRKTLPRSLTPIHGLMDIVERLRAPDGCPWDRKQTPRQLSTYLVEEMFELLDAVENKGYAAVREEMGDVLFLLVFMARLYAEKEFFDLMDVAREAAEKMIRRHPHVFGDRSLSTADEVRKQWREIKQSEKTSDGSGSILDSIPVHQPAMFRAYQVSKRASRVGFDWKDVAGVIDKAEEEWRELRAALNSGDMENMEEEFGDLLFTLVNVGRLAGVHPERALLAAIRKFEARFRFMENTLKIQGKDIESIGPETMDDLWEAAKEKLAGTTDSP